MHDLAAKRADDLKGLELWTFNVGDPFMPKRSKPFLGYEPRWKHGMLARSGNTGTYAIEAAALLGCTEIRLLGIDLRFDLAKSHFYGQNTYRGQRIVHKQSHLDRVTLCYRALHDRLKKEGIRLINESPYEGRLDEHIPREESPWLKRSRT